MSEHKRAGLNERERERLLDRLSRGSTSVGGSVPDTVDVQGTEVPLREFVFEIKDFDAVPEAERERADEMVTALRRERLQRRNRLASDDDLTAAEGEQLVESIVGLDRAINPLDSLDARGFEEQAREQWLDEQKRWSAFLHRIL
ncbi:hypothetical protein SAMN04487949_2667 [Halogranum gelatinilyticum]|uniref:Uncharacterized protein n=1 Tax=Halogranum gelatinilyticum TaxID=660521 RepID=A0A1G9W995_9EURY|nr:DUF5788 family protein [Halogranum gelatinilyticum]SDM81102.1 hypothetical protein SAMN04487949_2667 [Halogranum gelatinilyticum]